MSGFHARSGWALAGAAVLAAFSACSAAEVAGISGSALEVESAAAEIAANPAYTALPLTVECWVKLRLRDSYNILIAQ